MTLAADLVDQGNELAELRRGLRVRLGRSPLADGATFLCHVEQAYRAFTQAILGTSGAETPVTLAGAAGEPDAR
jgi:hypothetical protein